MTKNKALGLPLLQKIPCSVIFFVSGFKPLNLGLRVEWSTTELPGHNRMQKLKESPPHPKYDRKIIQGILKWEVSLYH